MLNDYQTRKIITILENNRQTTIKNYFYQYSRKAREAVKVVTCDMSGAYIPIIKQLFPNAKISSQAIRCLLAYLLTCLLAYLLSMLFFPILSSFLTYIIRIFYQQVLFAQKFLFQISVQKEIWNPLNYHSLLHLKQMETPY